MELDETASRKLVRAEGRPAARNWKRLKPEVAKSRARTLPCHGHPARRITDRRWDNFTARKLSHRNVQRAKGPTGGRWDGTVSQNKGDPAVPGGYGRPRRGSRRSGSQDLSGLDESMGHGTSRPAGTCPTATSKNQRVCIRGEDGTGLVRKIDDRPDRSQLRAAAIARRSEADRPADGHRWGRTGRVDGTRAWDNFVPRGTCPTLKSDREGVYKRKTMGRDTIAK
jgi:hypothetical protein